MEKKGFDWKSFISFGLFLSFLVISITGVVLYIAPAGRVAKWVNWELMGLSKEGWQALHTNFSYLFLVLGVFHLFFMNWRVFVSYIKKRASSGIHRKKEMGWGTLLFLVVFLGTLFKLPPLQTVMDIGEYFTESWEKTEEKAPMPHTEELTIAEIADKLVELSPDAIIKKLAAAGYGNVTPEMKLKDIGEKSGKSPFEVYRIILENADQRKMDMSVFKEGSGVGRKTLREIAEMTGGDVELMLTRLKEAGIEAKADEMIKDIATRAEKTPLEVVQLSSGN